MGSGEADKEGQLEALLANANIWYKSLDLLLGPLLRRYQVQYIPSMAEFITAVQCWLHGAATEEKRTNALDGSK